MLLLKGGDVWHVHACQRCPRGSHPFISGAIQVTSHQTVQNSVAHTYIAEENLIFYLHNKLHRKGLFQYSPT